MSPPSRLCLLVVLGALVAWANRVDPHPELREILENISEIVDVKSVNGIPPFNGVIRSIKVCQNREEVKLVNATLQVYMRVLESILRPPRGQHTALLDSVPEATREHLRHNVGQLTNKMRHLTDKLARRHCPDVPNVLHQLAQLKPSQTSQHLTCFTSASPSAPSQELNLERTCTCTRVELRMAAMARAMLGVCVYLCVCRVRTSHVPPRMNRSIQNLLQLYKIPPKERFNGRPVFSRELLGTKMEARDMLMSAVLQTYEELLGNMLKQLSDPTAWTTGATATSGASASDRDPVPSVDARAELSYLLRRVQDLRKYRYQAQEKVLDGLGKLQHIQMDNLVVQSKALWELPWLYEEASALVESGRERRRRRRRQTLRRPQTVTSSTSNPN